MKTYILRNDYLDRTISPDISRISNDFKIVLINGPRQIGKTTLLKHISEANRKYVSLDNPSDLLLAKNDPKGFVDVYSPPVIIDEIQYAPELFPYLKMFVDASNQRGGIWMTGSQQYNMMQGVTESLAGRVVIIDLLGLSVYEREGFGLIQRPFLPSPEPVCNLRKKGIRETFRIIWQGAFPDVIHKDRKSHKYFFDSYIRTYIERDVRQLINIGNEVDFITFLKVLAARTGQEMNIADIARNVGIATQTAKKWISILKASGLLFLLQPFHKNITKRLVKKPKMYFLDTGLAAYLAGWTTPEALETGISAGAFFETFVISEILKSYFHNGENPQLYFFRDEKGVEIDLLIYQNGLYYPVEIKKHATPSFTDISAFKIFNKIEKIGFGSEICLCSEPQKLSPDAIAISVWDI